MLNEKERKIVLQVLKENQEGFKRLAKEIPAKEFREQEEKEQLEFSFYKYYSPKSLFEEQNKKSEIHL